MKCRVAEREYESLRWKRIGDKPNTRVNYESQCLTRFVNIGAESCKFYYVCLILIAKFLLWQIKKYVLNNFSYAPNEEK